MATTAELRAERELAAAILSRIGGCLALCGCEDATIVPCDPFHGFYRLRYWREGMGVALDADAHALETHAFDLARFVAIKTGR